MIGTRRTLLTSGLATVMALPTIRRARAAGFPDRPVRLVVPFAPGGPADTQARLLGQGMGDALGQPIVVENRSGGGGTIGIDAVAKAAPDGYTLAFGSTGALVITNRIMPNPPYEPERDLTPITMVSIVPLLLMTGRTLPVHTVQELLALARQKGGLTFASTGPGSAPHLAGEMLRMRTNLTCEHVAYRGAAPASLAIMNGEVDFGFADPTAVLPQIRDGSLRALAVTSPQRNPALSEVPTMAEAGVSDIVLENWYPLMAPAHTPPDRVDRLFQAANKTLSQPALRQQLLDQGISVVASTPAATRAFLHEEAEKWAALVKAAGVRME